MAYLKMTSRSYFAVVGNNLHLTWYTTRPNTIQHARVSPPSEATKSAAVPKQGANSINIPSGKVDYGLMILARRRWCSCGYWINRNLGLVKKAYSDALNKPDAIMRKMFVK